MLLQESHPLAVISKPIDVDSKAPVYHELEKTDVTSVEWMRHVPGSGSLPCNPVLITEDDAALIDRVRERLAKPQRVRVSLGDL